MFRGKKNEGKKHRCERNIDRLTLACWPATQACAPTGNGTGGLLVCGMAPNPLSHMNQGWTLFKLHLLTEKLIHVL